MDSQLRIPAQRERGYQLLEEIVDGLASHVGRDLEREHDVLAAASAGQRAIFALVTVDGEVNNGGLEQYFFNSWGALLDEAIEGAELIEAPRHAAILKAAAGVFPDGCVPENREERWDALDALSEEQLEELSALDDRWFAHERELERRMVAYVQANPEEFFR